MCSDFSLNTPGISSESTTHTPNTDRSSHDVGSKQHLREKIKRHEKDSSWGSLRPASVSCDDTYSDNNGKEYCGFFCALPRAGVKRSPRDNSTFLCPFRANLGGGGTQRMGFLPAVNRCCTYRRSTQPGAGFIQSRNSIYKYECDLF